MRGRFGNVITDCCIKLLATDIPGAGVKPVTVRIGAHLGSLDGNDPLRQVLMASVLNTSHSPSAADEPMAMLLVEPQPHVFAALQRAIAPYRGRVVAKHAAACAADGNVTFYYLPGVDPVAGGSGFGAGASQIASLSREHILWHQKYVHKTGLRLEDHIRELVLPCLSIPTLLSLYAIDGTNLGALTVDAEGHDLDILESADWDKLAPRLVVWEQRHINKHASFGGKNRTATFVTKLRLHGYACNARSDPENVWCLHGEAVRQEPACRSFAHTAQPG